MPVSIYRIIATRRQKLRSFDKQVGGSHYRKLNVQPTEYNELNMLTFAEGNVVKYVSRHRIGGGGREDIEKAIHYLEIILDTHYSPSRGRNLGTPTLTEGDKDLNAKDRAGEVVDKILKRNGK